MSEHTQQPRTNAESTSNSEQSSRTEYVERSDIGVSLTVKLKRGTGTRDQDEVIAKAKGKTLEDAREDMEILREYIHDFATTMVLLHQESNIYSASMRISTGWTCRSSASG